MTRPALVLLTLLAAGALSACAKEDEYPISGEECTAEDPVLGVEAEMTGCVPTI
jgi:hypothetical protein